MKTLLLSLLLVTGSTLWASMALTQTQMVSLEVHDQSGHLQGSVEIPREHADLSITITNLLNDIDPEVHTDRVHIPVYDMTLETCSRIKAYLAHLSSYLKQDDLTTLDRIKDDLGELSVPELFEVLRGVNYLSIPQLLRWGIEVAKEKPITDISFAQIGHLLVSNALIKHYLEKIAGITYEKTHATQFHQDDDDSDAFSDHVAILSSAKVCRCHEGWVYSVSVTADQRIVSGSLDKTVRVWSMEGKELAVCACHEGPVTSVSVTADQRIVSGSRDRTIRVWSMEGKELAVCRGHEDLVKSVSVTADQRIVSGSRDKTIRVWSMEGKNLAVCEGHKDLVYSVLVTDDQRIVSGSHDCTLRVWSMEGKELAVCRGHELPVTSVSVSPDQRIVSGSFDKTIRVWSMEGNELAVCRGHERSVNSVSVTPHQKIVSGSADGTIRVWSMEGKDLAVCSGHEDSVRSVSVTANHRIVSGSDDNTVRVWSMEGKELAVCRGHTNYVYSIFVTADQRIVSGSYDNTIRVWNYWLVTFLKSMLISTEQSEKMWSYLQNHARTTLTTEACLDAVRTVLHEGSQPAARPSESSVVPFTTSILS